MQKTSTFCLKNLFWILLCLVWTGFTCVDAKAAEDLEIGEIEIGKTYTYSAFQKVYAQYTASENGVLTLTNSSPYGSFLNCFESRYTNTSDSPAPLQTASKGVLTVNVEAGKTYYFYQYMFDAGSFVASLNEQQISEIKLESLSPKEGSELDTVNGSTISFSFNINIKVDDASLKAGNNTEVLPVNITSGRFISVDVADALASLMKKEAVKEGDEVTVTLNNIRCAEDESIKYGEDGSLSVKFTVSKQAVKLLSINGASLTETTDLLSYYSEDDPSGKITLVFSNNIYNNEDDLPKVVLTFGDLEYGRIYEESLPFNIEGNKLTFDLTNKLRRFQDMMPNTDPSIMENKDAVSIKISNVKDEEGKYVEASQPGAVGSFTLSFKLKDISYSIASEFTPSKGTLKAGTPMEIWIKNGDKIKFNGIRFDYILNGQPKSMIVTTFEKTTSDLSPDEIILTFDCPLITADKGTQITVTLNELSANDGLDHSNDIKAVFDAEENTIGEEFAIISATFPNNAELASIDKGTILTVSTNMDDKVGYMEYVVKDITDDEVVKSRDILEKGEEGWTAEFYSKLTLKANHTYEATFTAYASEADKNYGKAALGTAVLTWNGTTPEFEFSPIKLLSVSPEPDENGAEQITEAKDFTVKLTFDGGVDLNAAIMEGYGMTSPLASCTPNEDKTVWTLVVGADYLYSSGEALSITVNATDAATGKRVRGTLGLEDQSYWIFSYICTVNVPNIAITTENGETNKFYITCNEGISPSYNGSVITINKEGVEEPVKTIKASNINLVYPEGCALDYVPTEAYFDLDPALEDGTYTIHVERGFFILGSSMVTYNNKTTDYTFCVKNGKGPRQEFFPYSTTPETTDEIFSIKDIKLNLFAAASIKEGAKARLSSRFGASYEADITVDPADESGKTLLISFDNEISTPGSYTLTIPENVFGDADFVSSELPCGNSNPALSYIFTVSEELKPIVVTPADKSEVESLTSFKFENVTGHNYQGEMLLKDSEGKTVATISGSSVDYTYDENDPFGAPLYLSVTLEEPVTLAGNYTLEIPEGFFYVGSNSDPAEAMTLTYTVTGKSTAVDMISTDAVKSVTVYTINGQLIGKDREPAFLNTLKKGIYIVNGKKMVIK